MICFVCDGCGDRILDPRKAISFTGRVTINERTYRTQPGQSGHVCIECYSSQPPDAADESWNADRF